MKKLLSCLYIALLLGACEKKYELPDEVVKPAGPTLTIAQLKKRISGSNSLYAFKGGDSSLYLTITMDETSGNIYKQVYAEDLEGSGIQLRLLNSGGLYEGDNIRLLLGRLSLVASNNMLYLDSISVEKDVVKLASGSRFSARTVTMDQLLNAPSVLDAQNLQSQYVRITDIEFSYESRGKPLANIIARSSVDHYFGKCFGKTIALRTSGLCQFAGQLVPAGHGEITGILQQYNTAYSLVLKTHGDLQLAGETCGKTDTSQSGTYLYKDFEDKSLSSGGWLQIQSSGSISWTSSNYAQSSYYARISNKVAEVYQGGQTWLISPIIDLQKAQSPILHFITAVSSTLSPLDLLLTEEVDANLPDSAIWLQLKYVSPTNGFSYMSSGDLSLSQWKGRRIRLAFRYNAQNTAGAIWNLDNIVIKER